MSRRVSLPGADELFRTTGGRALQPSSPRQHVNGDQTAAGVPAQPSTERALRPVPDTDDEGADDAAGDAEPGEAARAAEPAEHGGRGAQQPSSATGAPPSRPMPEHVVRRTPPPPAPPPAAATGSGAAQQPRRKAPRANRRPSGRERHDEKITVYVSAEELMDLERARLVLRGEHGLAVDRGRIVREAVAVVLADLESRGDASILVRRLRGR